MNDKNPLVFVAIVIALLLYGLRRFSRHATVSHWRDWAERYRAVNLPKPAIRFGVLGISFFPALGGRRLDIFARLTPATEGLYLSMPWIFRLFHPTLLIPWRDLSLAPLTDSLVGNTQKLDVRGGGYLVVRMNTYDALEKYLPHQPNRSRPLWARGQIF